MRKKTALWAPRRWIRRDLREWVRYLVQAAILPLLLVTAICTNVSAWSFGYLIFFFVSVNPAFLARLVHESFVFRLLLLLFSAVNFLCSLSFQIVIASRKSPKEYEVSDGSLEDSIWLRAFGLKYVGLDPVPWVGFQVFVPLFFLLVFCGADMVFRVFLLWNASQKRKIAERRKVRFAIAAGVAGSEVETVNESVSVISKHGTESSVAVSVEAAGASGAESNVESCMDISNLSLTESILHSAHSGVFVTEKSVIGSSRSVSSLGLETEGSSSSVQTGMTQASSSVLNRSYGDFSEMGGLLRTQIGTGDESKESSSRVSAESSDSDETDVEESEAESEETSDEAEEHVSDVDSSEESTGESSEESSESDSLGEEMLDAKDVSKEKPRSPIIANFFVPFRPPLSFGRWICLCGLLLAAEVKPNIVLFPSVLFAVIALLTFSLPAPVEGLRLPRRITMIYDFFQGWPEAVIYGCFWSFMLLAIALVTTYTLIVSLPWVELLDYDSSHDALSSKIVTRVFVRMIVGSHADLSPSATNWQCVFLCLSLVGCSILFLKRRDDKEVDDVSADGRADSEPSSEGSESSGSKSSSQDDDDDECESSSLTEGDSASMTNSLSRVDSSALSEMFGSPNEESDPLLTFFMATNALRLGLGAKAADAVNAAQENALPTVNEVSNVIGVDQLDSLRRARKKLVFHDSTTSNPVLIIIYDWFGWIWLSGLLIAVAFTRASLLNFIYLLTAAFSFMSSRIAFRGFFPFFLPLISVFIVVQCVWAIPGIGLPTTDITNTIGITWTYDVWFSRILIQSMAIIVCGQYYWFMERAGLLLASAAEIRKMEETETEATNSMMKRLKSMWADRVAPYVRPQEIVDIDLAVKEQQEREDVMEDGGMGVSTLFAESEDEKGCGTGSGSGSALLRGSPREEDSEPEVIISEDDASSLEDVFQLRSYPATNMLTVGSSFDPLAPLRSSSLPPPLVIGDDNDVDACSVHSGVFCLPEDDRVIETKRRKDRDDTDREVITLREHAAKRSRTVPCDAEGDDVTPSERPVLEAADRHEFFIRRVFRMFGAVGYQILRSAVRISFYPTLLCLFILCLRDISMFSAVFMLMMVLFVLFPGICSRVWVVTVMWFDVALIANYLWQFSFLHADSGPSFESKSTVGGAFVPRRSLFAESNNFGEDGFIVESLGLKRLDSDSPVAMWDGLWLWVALAFVSCAQWKLYRSPFYSKHANADSKIANALADPDGAAGSSGVAKRFRDALSFMWYVWRRCGVFGTVAFILILSLSSEISLINVVYISFAFFVIAVFCCPIHSRIVRLVVRHTWWTIVLYSGAILVLLFASQVGHTLEAMEDAWNAGPGHFMRFEELGLRRFGSLSERRWHLSAGVLVFFAVGAQRHMFSVSGSTDEMGSGRSSLSTTFHRWKVTQFVLRALFLHSPKLVEVSVFFVAISEYSVVGALMICVLLLFLPFRSGTPRFGIVWLLFAESLIIVRLLYQFSFAVVDSEPEKVLRWVGLARWDSDVDAIVHVSGEVAVVLSTVVLSVSRRVRPTLSGLERDPISGLECTLFLFDRLSFDKLKRRRKLAIDSLYLDSAESLAQRPPSRGMFSSGSLPTPSPTSPHSPMSPTLSSSRLKRSKSSMVVRFHFWRLDVLPTLRYRISMELSHFFFRYGLALTVFFLVSMAFVQHDIMGTMFIVLAFVIVPTPRVVLRRLWTVLMFFAGVFFVARYLLGLQGPRSDETVPWWEPEGSDPDATRADWVVWFALGEPSRSDLLANALVVYLFALQLRMFLAPTKHAKAVVSGQQTSRVQRWSEAADERGERVRDLLQWATCGVCCRRKAVRDVESPAGEDADGSPGRSYSTGLVNSAILYAILSCQKRLEAWWQYRMQERRSRRERKDLLFKSVSEWRTGLLSKGKVKFEERGAELGEVEHDNTGEHRDGLRRRVSVVGIQVEPGEKESDEERDGESMSASDGRSICSSGTEATEPPRVLGMSALVGEAVSAGENGSLLSSGVGDLLVPGESVACSCPAHTVSSLHERSSQQQGSSIQEQARESENDSAKLDQKFLTLNPSDRVLVSAMKVPRPPPVEVPANVATPTSRHIHRDPLFARLRLAQSFDHYAFDVMSQSSFATDTTQFEERVRRGVAMGRSESGLSTNVRRSMAPRRVRRSFVQFLVRLSVPLCSVGMALCCGFSTSILSLPFLVASLVFFMKPELPILHPLVWVLTWVYSFIVLFIKSFAQMPFLSIPRRERFSTRYDLFLYTFKLFGIPLFRADGETAFAFTKDRVLPDLLIWLICAVEMLVLTSTEVTGVRIRLHQLGYGRLAKLLRHETALALDNSTEKSKFKKQKREREKRVRSLMKEDSSMYMYTWSSSPGVVTAETVDADDAMSVTESLLSVQGAVAELEGSASGAPVDAVVSASGDEGDGAEAASTKEEEMGEEALDNQKEGKNEHRKTKKERKKEKKLKKKEKKKQKKAEKVSIKKKIHAKVKKYWEILKKTVWNFIVELIHIGEGNARYILSSSEEMDPSSDSHVLHVRREPDPVSWADAFLRLLRGLWVVLLAHSKEVAYLCVALNMMFNPSMISMIAALSTFCFAAFCYPAPPFGFWRMLAVYSAAVLVISFCYQSSPFCECVHDTASEGGTWALQPYCREEECRKDLRTENYDLGLDYPWQIGIFKRHVFRSGWGTTWLPADSAIAYDKNKNEPPQPVYFFAPAAWDLLVFCSAVVNMFVFDHWGIPRLRSKSSCETHHKKRKKVRGIFGRLKDRFKRTAVFSFLEDLMWPRKRQQPGRDVYGLVFVVDATLFTYLTLLFNRVIRSEDDTFSLISQSRIPALFVVVLVLDFFWILYGRVLFLKRALRTYFCSMVAHCVLMHATLFIWIPHYYDYSVSLTKSPVLLGWYFLLACGWVAAGRQVAYGFPLSPHRKRLTSGDPPSHMQFLLFETYRALPFAYEISSLLSWIVAPSTLSWFDWLTLEEIDGNLFRTAYDNRRKTGSGKNEQRGLGKPRGKREKIIPFALIAGLLFVIWAPLFLMTSSETNLALRENLIERVDIRVSLKSYSPLYAIEILSDASFVSRDEWLRLIREADFLQPDDFSALQRLTIPDFSDSIWTIAPPRRSALLQELSSILGLDGAINMEFLFKFERAGPADNAMIEFSVMKPLAAADVEEFWHFLEFGNSTVGSSWFVVTGCIPRFMDFPISGGPLLRYQGGTIDMNFTYEYNADEKTEWWAMRQADQRPKCASNRCPFGPGDVLFYIVSRKYPSGLTLLFLSSTGIISIYIGIVYTVSRFVRFSLSNLQERLPYQYLPSTDELRKRVSNVYLARNARQFALEERLWANLVAIYRSPEALVAHTKVVEQGELEPPALYKEKRE